MFSTKEYLEKKTGPYGIGRLSYLQSLVTEFQDTTSDDAKEQVLANLANFAYDPINYEFFKKLNVVDLFLDCLEENNEKLIEFSIAGLCNCCLGFLSADKELKEHILNSNGVSLVIKCLSRPQENTVMSAITTLMFLITPQSKKAITALPVVECMLRFAQCKNKQLSNLAQVFLQDYCTAELIEEAKEIQRKMAAQFSPTET